MKESEKVISSFDVKTPGTNTLATALSGGNQQKFVVGREIIKKPRVFFVAQPTWGVDVGSANEIRRKLINLRDAGGAILVISEELEELFEITDRMYVLRSGRMSPSIRTSEVSPDKIGEYMIGEKREEMDHSSSA